MACPRSFSNGVPTSYGPSSGWSLRMPRSGQPKRSTFQPSRSPAPLGTSSTQLQNLSTGPAGIWNYAGALTGPIFTGGAISGQVAQAEAGQRAALANYERSIQNAFADVDGALSSREQLGEQLVAQERLVKALQEYSELAQLRYDGGYSPYSTVLQAEERLFPEELVLAATRAQLLAPLVSIYRAMGGGWVNEADQLAPQPVAESGLLAPPLPPAGASGPK